MAAFNYQALSKQGKEHQGILEGDSERQIRQQLRDQGLTPLKIEAVHGGGKNKKNQQRLTTPEMALLTRQLSTLIGAGLPLEEAIQGVAEQADKSKIKSLLLAVRAKITEGHSLAISLAEFPRSFSTLYCATVAAGEEAGHLPEVLNRLADYTEQQQILQQKVKQALIYPTLMVVVSILIVAFLLSFVVPKMIHVFISSHQQLPTPTLILIAFSHGVKVYGLYVLAALLIGIAVLVRLLKQARFRFMAHRFLLKLPIVGNAIKVMNTARFSRTLGILSGAGVSVLDAMQVSGSLVTSLPIRKAIQAATAKVREGANIHLALKQTGYFPPMSIHLIASGEATGQLEAMLERAANNQEREVEALIANILALFEPAIMLIMGAVVLFIVLAIMLPIFSLDQMSG